MKSVQRDGLYTIYRVKRDLTGEWKNIPTSMIRGYLLGLGIWAEIISDNACHG